MPRVRVLPQNQAVYVSDSPATESGDVAQLHQVISFSDNANVERENITVYGKLAPDDRVITDATVGIDTTWYTTNGLNEFNIGLLTDGVTNALSNILDKSEDERNWFKKTVPEGSDAIGYDSTGQFVHGYGNVYVTSLSFEGAVEDFLQTTVSAEGLNLNVEGPQTGATIDSTPAVNPDTGADDNTTFTIPTATSRPSAMPSVIRRGDITLDFGTMTVPGVDLSEMHVTNFTIEADMSRDPLLRFGSRFAFSREFTEGGQIPLTMTVTADKSDLSAGSWAALVRKCEEDKHDLTITCRECDEDGVGDVAIQFICKGMFLDERNVDGAVGDSDTANLTFATTVGGPEDTENGLFILGTHAGGT